MTEKSKAWVKKNGPLVGVLLFAILALLYLGDDIITQRASRITLEAIPPVADDLDPKQGAVKPTATIIEFGDFACTVCQLQVSILKDIINDFPNEVQLVWKDVPVDLLHPEARTASIAGHCAARQGKFWEMHDLLFSRQSELGDELYAELAQTLELNEQEFSSCLANRETENIIEQNIASAEAAKITSTPTFFINDVKYEGFMEYQEIIQALTGA